MEKKTITKLFIHPTDRDVLESAKEILSKIVEAEEDNSELQIMARQGIVKLNNVLNDVECTITGKVTNIDTDYFDKGYSQGRQDGYDEGYDMGYKDCHDYLAQGDDE